jgi:predicted transcriptional regulator of viral defense system
MEVRSLSAREAQVVLTLEAEGKDEVTVDGIRRSLGITPGFARKLAHDLSAKGWVERVGRGRYLLAPARNGPEALPDTDPFRVGGRLAHPYYFGYATAAELLRLLPQASRTYYVVTPTRVASRTTRVAEYRMVRVTPSRFFGVRPLERRGLRIEVSDLERTVLDCLDRPEFSGGIAGAVRVLESAGRDLDWKRLETYLGRFGHRSLGLRLGYLAERLRPRVAPPESWVRRLRARPGEPYVALGPPKEFGRRGRHDRTWHVIENVPPAVLLGEVDLR